MNRRGGEGPMDGLEFQNANVDKSSPFVLYANQNPALPSQNPAAQPRVSFGTNLFQSQNAVPRNASPLRQQQTFPRAPERSVFSPSISHQYTAAPLRNPAFTSVRPGTPAFMTPQKDRFEDSVMSETPADDSPAMTDASGPADTSADTPDFDNSGLLDGMTISTPDHRVSRTLFSEKRSGRGELPNLRQGDWFQRGKVRKRFRTDRDKDVGSARLRLPDGRDEDDSDDDDDDEPRAGRRNRRNRDTGWLHHILTSISSNPNAPMIISWYLQVLFNAACGGVVLWMAWGIISAIRGEVLYSSEKARAQLMEEMNACSRRYIENKCSPIQDRLPALEGMCNEWETCMSQDSNVVAGVKASAGHLADILNEFFSRLSWKATVTLSTFSIIAMLVCNVAFSKFRHNYREQTLHQGNPGSQYQGMGPMGFPMSPGKNQAYIFAPIGQTPKHIRRAFLQDDTESEASPDARYLPPPVTPSRTRSPIKSERSRSPTKMKLEMSPSKMDRSQSPSKRSPSKRLEWQL
ncbi:hypothetical protein KVR01_009176 [Diaporthe batatas]|uniref:uncharacterized protein n=1 Tax=Diaporthe batatas TaxID=748121 RepID=UPI001D038CFC|nr:uncharacterized protein KVR01_009176 [Diaporthe batatas]KAG8160912.1 hypothetical protein KVR01_009176 [Diaporthe batatas]